MMKNRFLFVAMLFATLSLGFVSCDNKGNNPDDPTKGGQNEQDGSHKGHAYVDLGLPSGLKWATCNVGATKPEEYGNYYAWGETTPKTEYNWSTYKWCNGSENTMTKYCTNSDYGTVDYKTILDPKDDAASVNMGGSWRMPTKGEWMELQEECTWEWKQSYKGTTAGYLVTSKANGNSIFFPAAGCRDGSGLYGAGLDGGCWSSSLNTGRSGRAYGLYFGSDDVSWSSDGRCCGRSVRGVFSK